MNRRTNNRIKASSWWKRCFGFIPYCVWQQCSCPRCIAARHWALALASSPLAPIGRLELLLTGSTSNKKSHWSAFIGLSNLFFFLPFSRHFVWSFCQINVWNKSTGFNKCSIWHARLLLTMNYKMTHLQRLTDCLCFAQQHDTLCKRTKILLVSGARVCFCTFVSVFIWLLEFTVRSLTLGLTWCNVLITHKRTPTLAHTHWWPTHTHTSLR